jgi:predicted PurR-regulated permease PerM
VSRKPAEPMPRGPRVGGWTIAAVLTARALVHYALRYSLLPFVYAATVGFVADPLIVRLQRLRSPRWPVAVGLYLLFLAVLGAGGYWIGISAAADLMRVAAEAPKMLRRFIEGIVGPRVDLLGHVCSSAQLVEKIGGVAAAGAGGFGYIAGSVLTGVLSALLLLVLIPYFLISGPRLAAGGSGFCRRSGGNRSKSCYRSSSWCCAAI